jgi:hypothetical protein
MDFRNLEYMSNPMKKPISLSIPAPCPEKWDNFLPTSQGGYCSSCKKDVIDFTQWSENQIKDFFKNGNGATCGRFRKDQLKIYSLDSTPNYNNRFFPISLFGITLLLTSNQAEAAERKTPEIRITSLKSALKNNKTVTTDTLERKTITGIIKAEDDQSPLPGVNVVLKNTNIGAVTNVDGRFSIEIPAPKESDVLVFSFIGYETIEKNIFEVNESPITLKLDVAVLGQTIVAGGICVRRWSPRTIWWRIKNAFR